MIFKLVRVDGNDTHKTITLSHGAQVIGRGEFLGCCDKRISRKHGEIIVGNGEQVAVKALHPNPCFYQIKGCDKTEVLRQDSEIYLKNGDRFGLLPDSCWYEISLHTTQDMNPYSECTKSLDSEQNSNVEADSQSTICNDTEEINPLQDNTGNKIEKQNCDENSVNVGKLNTTTQGNNSENAAGAEDFRMVNTDANETVENNEPSPSLLVSEDHQITSKEIKDEPKSPIKRSHSEEDIKTDQLKKVKVEPNEDTELDQKPGPSNTADVPSNKDDNTKADAPVAVPPVNPANGPLRERCMYGANCYRRNVQHRAQFAHPSDPDWGPGERGICPWGRHCSRRDPRHFRDHDHPDGPPAPRFNPQPGKRQRKRRDSSDDKASISTDAIVTGKRARKTIRRPSWSSSDSDLTDPFLTDESDEWQPSTDYTDSQDYSQNL